MFEDHNEILKTLARNKALVIGCGVLLGAAGWGVSAIMPPVYEASVRLEIQQPAQRTGWSEQALGASSAQVENLNLFTCAERVKRRSLLARLASELEQRGTWVARARSGAPDGFVLPWDAVAQAQSPPAGTAPLASAPPRVVDACVVELGSMIAVRPVRDTRMMDIVVQGGAPEIARTIANRIAVLFVDDERQRAFEADTSGLATLEDELETTKQQLDARGVMRQPVVTEEDGLVRARRARLAQAMSDLDGATQQADDARREADLRLVKLERYANAPDTSIWTATGDESLDALHRELQACARRLAAARAIYRPLHPKLAAIDSEYAELLALERRALPGTLRDLRAQAAMHAAHVSRLRSAMADSEQVLASLETRQASREASVNGAVALAQAGRELQDRIEERIRDRRLEAPLAPPPVVLVDAAMVEPDPVRPRRALNVLAGLFGGLLFGSGLALVRKPSRTALERPEQMEEDLDVPVLTMVPDGVGEARP